MPSFNDKLTIDTPEQIALEYEIAGPGSRFMALFVDLMIQVVVFLILIVLMLMLGVSMVATIGSESGKWTYALLIFGVFAVQWGYFVAFEIFWKGQTPGKRQAGIRVINESGREASVYEAVSRNLLRAVDSLPGMYAVGAIVMFISPQNKRLGDYVAGTVVVHDRKPEEDSIFFNTRSSDVVGDIDYRVLSVTDLQVLETFLQRRLDLPYDLRQQSAQRLADHFGEKCKVAKASRPDNENFLEIVVRGYRSFKRFERANG
jgi:uncharacterized RDD family membrane protein YckC